MLFCSNISLAQKNKQPVTTDGTGKKVDHFYITTDQQFIMYQWLTDFHTAYDSADYATVKLYSQTHPIKIPKELVGDWCQLYWYQNKYCVYGPSDWGNNYRFSLDANGILKQYFMDGVVIKNVTKIEKEKYGKMKIYCNDDSHLIWIVNDPQKKILVNEVKEENDQYCELFVSASKVKNYPMLYADNPNEKMQEFQFADHYNCEKFYHSND